MSDIARSLSMTGGALERDEHVSSVLRLRRACTVGVVMWPAFALVDAFIVAFVYPGRLWFYLLLRALGIGVMLVGVMVAYRRPMPSPTTIRWTEALGLAALAALISVASVESGGITSPVVMGVVLVLVGRAAIIADEWKRAILPIALTSLAHPVSLAFSAAVVPEMAAQFRNRDALAAFALNEMFLFAAAILTLVGGHMVWSLRRQVFRTRSLGRYRLRERIGEGGMGEVWAAHHQGLRRDVAVKILKPETAGDPGAIARFEREVRATAELVHPHTVRVFDYGVTEDGLWYYAMELLHGVDLAGLVSRQGPLEPPRAAYLVAQAARALSEAHGRGIVHRDIKPENLFVTAPGGVGEFIKVLDFGLAKLARADAGATLTGEGWAVGTPRWAAPEMVSGGVAEPRSDLYSLGAVLYFLLVGSPPFDYTDVGKMLMAHATEEPVPPSSRSSRPIPPEIEAVVMRCLDKDPTRRFPSAESMAATLDAAIGMRWYGQPAADSQSA